MSAQDGTDYKGSFSIAPKGTAIGALVWVSLGMLNTKALDSKYATADSTADSTPDHGVTAIATRLSHELSIDAVAYDDAVYNQRILKAHYFSPSAITAGQPEVWIRLDSGLGEKYIGYFLMTGWKNDMPKDDVVTWNMSAVCQGKLTYTAA